MRLQRPPTHDACGALHADPGAAVVWQVQVVVQGNVQDVLALGHLTTQGREVIATPTAALTAICRIYCVARSMHIPMSMTFSQKYAG